MTNEMIKRIHEEGLREAAQKTKEILDDKTWGLV